MTLEEIERVKKALGDRIRSSVVVRISQGGQPGWALKAEMFDGVMKLFCSLSDLDDYFQVYF